jgi:hypothetical protein
MIPINPVILGRDLNLSVKLYGSELLLSSKKPEVTYKIPLTLLQTLCYQN